MREQLTTLSSLLLLSDSFGRGLVSKRPMVNHHRLSIHRAETKYPSN